MEAVEKSRIQFGIKATRHLRLLLACLFLVWSVADSPDEPMGWGPLAVYWVLSIGAYFFNRRPNIRIWYYMLLDVTLVTYFTYIAGSKTTIITGFYFVLLINNIIQGGKKLGLAALILSIAMFFGLVLLEQWTVLPASPYIMEFSDSILSPTGHIGSALILLIALICSYVYMGLALERINRSVKNEHRMLKREIDVQARYQKLQKQLEETQRLEGLGRLAGGVAHDFNNLLTCILGYSRCLRDELDPLSSMAKDVEEVIDAGERASQLTSQLLAFSRRQMIQLKILDLNELVIDIKKMLERIIGEDITFNTCLFKEPALVKADSSQLQQVIMNLVVNARDAMPGGGTLTISLSQITDNSTHEEKVVLSVRDTGVGMDEEIRLRIFEPFFTTKDVGQGTGLGLATVYGIVKQNNGAISVESQPGMGSVFNVILPRKEGVVEKEEKLQITSKQGSETILLVEDETVVRKIVTRILKGYGYNVLGASTGNEALELVSNFDGKIELLLSDVVMPDGSGIELADEIVKIKPAIKVVFMSGYSDEILTKNRVPFLKKPFSAMELSDVVRTTIDSTV